MMHTLNDGVIDPASWEEWLKMADENGLSLDSMVYQQ